VGARSPVFQGGMAMRFVESARNAQAPPFSAWGKSPASRQ